VSISPPDKFAGYSVKYFNLTCCRATMSCEVVRLFVFIKHVLVLCGALCKLVRDPSNRILGSPLCAPRTLPSEFHSETSSINNPNVFYCFISFEMHF